MAGLTEHKQLTERLIEDQRRCWRAGQPRKVEEYVAENTVLAANEEAVLDLIYAEICLREELAETVELSEYELRFPRLASNLSRLFEVHASLRSGTADEAAGKDMDMTIDRPQSPMSGAETSSFADPSRPHDTLTGISSKLDDAVPIGEALATGSLLGDYRILGVLGEGGMGLVYKAEHRRMKRIVALKVVSARVGNALQVTERFCREVEAVARLKHPHIVTAYDAREDGGLLYFVMELIAGHDLAKLVREKGAADLGDALRFVLEAARGLEYAHKHGIVHRDIKPSNILLDDDGSVKILDLGLVHFDPTVAGEKPRDMTTSGMIVGTVDYMAPEQAKQAKLVDGRADIYSLGCTLFYLLTGKPPYDGDSIIERLLAHREQPIPSLQTVRPQTPAEVDKVFQRMVAKRPEDRFQTMHELIAELEAVRKQLADKSRLVSSSLPEPMPVRRSFRRRAIIAALAFLSLSGGIYLYSILVKVKTRQGTVIIEVDQPGVEIAVDGDKVKLTPSDGKEPVEIAVSPGKHTLDVSKGGFKTATEKFTLESDGKPTVRVHLEPLVIAPSQTAAMPSSNAPPSPGAHGTGFSRNVSEHLPKGGTTSASIDLLAIADPSLASAGWSRVGQSLIGAGLNQPFVLPIPYSPPEEYDIDLTLTRKDGTGGIDVGLVAGGHQFHLAVNVANNDGLPISGFDKVDGQSSDSWHREALFINGHQHHIHCSVRRGRITASFDDRPICNYQGGNERLSLFDRVGLLSNRCLYLNTYESMFVIDEYRLTPIHGQGEVVSVPPLHDLEAARWFHARDAVAIMLSAHAERGVHTADNLPSEPFMLRCLTSSHRLTETDLRLLSALPQLSYLKLSACQLNDEQFAKIVNLPLLKILQLDTNPVTDAGLAQIGQRFPRLEVLDLSKTEVTDAGLARLEGIPLRTLNVTGTHVTPDAIDSFRFTSPDCIVIDDRHPTESRDRKAAQWVLSGGGQCEIDFLNKDGAVEHRALRDGTKSAETLPERMNLCLVNLPWKDIRDADMEHLARLPSLNLLDLRLSKNLSNVGLAKIADNRNLENVGLVDCKQITNAGMLTIKTWRRLKRLALQGTGISDAGLAQLTDLPSLEDLNVNATNLSDRGLAHVAKMKSLKVLSLPNGPFSKSGLLQLRDLQRLELLRQPSAIASDEELEWLGSLPQFRFLDDGGNGGEISDRGLKALARSKTLVFFNSWNLTGNITRDGWAALARIETLKQLDVVNSVFDDAALAVLVQPHRLGWLKINQSRVTDQGLAHLRGLPLLESLALDNRHITKVGVGHLSALPALRDLNLCGGQVTDEVFHWDWLSQMRKLEKVHCVDTKVTDSCIERLKREHPSIEFVRY